MKSKYLMLIAAMWLVAAGCVRTIHPILNDDQLIVDKTLAGLWVSENGEETADVKPPGDDKKYVVVYTDKDGKKANLVVRLGKVGDLLLAEITIAEPEGSDVYKFHMMPLYSFLVIRETTPRLKFSVMPQEWLEKYLAGHPRELDTVKVDDKIFIVSATTEDFQQFLLRHQKDEGAFGNDKPGVMVRPGDPTTRQADPAK
ncbi:MAG TPA: hypothetical protein VHD56_06070 [Tepidisphaeraceae bacterium]|nr:hypothetical protein [Tepidisphaeraceae bacterium]